MLVRPRSRRLGKIRALNLLDVIEQKFWKFFSKKTSFESVTLEQFHETAKRRK